MDKYLINDIQLSIPSSIEEIKSCFKQLLNEERATISFINPEIFMESVKNDKIRHYLSNTKYNFIDGIGLLKAINISEKTNFTSDRRFPGTDFFDYIPEDAHCNVFLYGASEHNNDLACKRLCEKYMNISIVGRLNGYSNLNDDEIVKLINASRPDVLIVCLGFPKQEEWIYSNVNKLDVRFLFGNGGSIDFWSESIKRAPDCIINRGFEWLYRLLQDFNLKRIKRQLKLIEFARKAIFREYTISRIIEDNEYKK